MDIFLGSEGRHLSSIIYLEEISSQVANDGNLEKSSIKCRARSEVSTLRSMVSVMAFWNGSIALFSKIATTT